MNYFFDDVNDWLSTGGDIDLAKDLTGLDYNTTIAQLRAHGVTHVLDVRSEWEDKAEWVAGGLSPENYRHVPIIDSHRHTPDEAWYADVADFVLRFWLDSAEGDRLYVHCHMGINRGPSAAMLALLTTDAGLSPFDAFLMVREARPAAGLVYAEAVGIWHLLNIDGIELTPDSELPDSVVQFSKEVRSYWTPEMIREVNRGIAYYRSAEGGTIKVGGQSTLACSSDPTHRVKWNSGDPACLDCGSPVRSVQRVDAASAV